MPEINAGTTSFAMNRKYVNNKISIDFFKIFNLQKARKSEEGLKKVYSSGK